MTQLQHRFSEIPYRRPDMDELRATYSGLKEQFSQAATAGRMNELVRARIRDGVVRPTQGMRILDEYMACFGGNTYCALPGPRNGDGK